MSKLSLPRPITDDNSKKKIKHLFDNQAIHGVSG